MQKYLLELELTNICNAQCIMCPVVDMKRKKGFMSRRTFENIINKGIDYGIQTIRFCGLGEPLLHKDFCQFLSYVKKHNHYATELITNGALLRKEIVHSLIKYHIDFLSISFPSLVRKSYEKIMKGLDFEKVLGRVLYAIQELKNTTGAHIKITSVITDINTDEKDDIKQFWSQKGVDYIQLHTPHNRGGHLDDVAYSNLSSQIEHALDSGSKKALCPWPLRQFFIAWDGSVFLCCCDMEGECRVGNVSMDKYSEMEKVQEMISLAQPKLCKRCSYQKANTVN